MLLPVLLGSVWLGFGLVLAVTAASEEEKGASYHVFDAATAWQVLPDERSSRSLLASGVTQANASSLVWIATIPPAIRAQAEALPSFSVVWSAMLSTTGVDHDMSLSFTCSVVTQRAQQSHDEATWIVTALVWIDDHLVCDESGTLPFPIPIDSGGSQEIRMVVLAKKKQEPTFDNNQQHTATIHGTNETTVAAFTSSASVLDFGLSWRPTVEQNDKKHTAYRSTLHPTLPPDVQRRIRLQQSQHKNRWGTWLHESFLAHVLLPSAVALRLAVDTDTASHVRCNNKLRPGLHALDHSYTRVSIATTITSSNQNNVTRWVHVSSATVNDDLVVLIELEEDVGSLDEEGERWIARDDYDTSTTTPLLPIYVGLHYAWNGTGAVEILRQNVDGSNDRIVGLQATPDGRSHTNVPIYATAPLQPTDHEFASIFGGSDDDDPGIVVQLDLAKMESSGDSSITATKFGLSTGRQRSLDEIVALIRSARDAMECTMSTDTQGYSADQKEGYRAMQSVLGWNVIFNPLELGPIVPVSRGWAFHDGYVLFEWDNLLASYMLAGMHGQAGSKALAYSNLIQTIKSRTTEGFVPNFAAGSDKSRDRTEPPLGAQILERIFREHGDVWIVRLLFDDLLAWNTWFWNHRRLDPLGLIALGSDPYDYQPEHHVNDMQAARYESGQDNSPMYDGDEDELFCKKRHKMLLYDVGMTALFVAEAQSLSRLGRMLHDREAVVQQLDARVAEMSQLLMDHLWDEGRSIFANRYQQGAAELSEVHSPTSFFPLLLGTVTDDAVDRMVKQHLLNDTRFCLVPYKHSNASSGCRFGVPASPFDHPSFVDQNYWRGRVWGPLNMILYWALEQYEHTPSAHQARKLLVDQSLQMLLIPWRAYGHVHENYNPLTGEGCDSGNSDPFYHWGALNAYMSALEHRRETENNESIREVTIT